MTYFYSTRSWSSQPQITEETINAWTHHAEKKNWRIVQLPNGFFQTEYKDINCDCDSKRCSCDKWYDVTRRETMDGAEAAIYGSIEHYNKKLEFIKGPKVIKTFE